LGQTNSRVFLVAEIGDEKSCLAYFPFCSLEVPAQCQVPLLRGRIEATLRSPQGIEISIQARHVVV